VSPFHPHHIGVGPSSNNKYNVYNDFYRAYENKGYYTDSPFEILIRQSL